MIITGRKTQITGLKNTDAFPRYLSLEGSVYGERKKQWGTGVSTQCKYRSEVKHPYVWVVSLCKGFRLYFDNYGGLIRAEEYRA